MGDQPQPSIAPPDTPCPSPFDMGFMSGIEVSGKVITKLEGVIGQLRQALIDIRTGAPDMSGADIAAIAEQALIASAQPTQDLPQPDQK